MKSSDKEFVAEAEDILQEAVGVMLDIQDTYQSEVDPDAVNALFRAMHTLKGMAGLFGHNSLSDISHNLESLLDDMRLGRAPLDESMVGFMFENLDFLRSILDAMKEGAPKEAAAIEKRVRIIEEFRDGLLNKGTHKADEGLGAIAGLLGILSEYEEHRLKSNIKAGKGVYVLNTEFSLENFDTLLKELTEKIKEGGELISTMPTSEGVPIGSIGFRLIIGTKESPEEVESHTGYTPEVLAPIRKAADMQATAPSQPVAEDRDADSAQAQAAVSAGSAGSTVVRVDISKIDRILDTVGEISLTRNSLRATWKDMAAQYGNTAGTIELYKILQSFDRRLLNLQHNVLDIRMVPMGQIFSRMAQVIRRYSRSAGKKINLLMFGEDTELDKFIAEEIVDPLMHVVRNAIDHGIEPGDVRAREGKPEAGTVKLKAYQKGNNVIMEVTDDGGGINDEKVRKKAIEMGMLQDDVELTHKEKLELLFSPGFSTADQVSETSGRGVGLDVVREKLSDLGGFVEVDSDPGFGTSFIITLPITLAIIRALTVRVGSERFAIPLSSMSETFSVRLSDLQGFDGGNIYNLRGFMLSVASLAEVLGMQDVPGEFKPVVVVGHGNRSLGLIVDEFIGQQEVVIKPLGDYFHGLRGFAGAAEVGRNEIILVLDAEAIISEIMESESTVWS